MSFYETAWVIFIYSFLGWCAEVVFAACRRGIFVNRGFLNGPVCPIYGFGVVCCIVALTPLSDSLVALFFGSMILTSALEFVTGWVLEKAFHTKWWDYSDVKFNLKGYICLEFSIIWGFAATFIMKLVHPAIYHVVSLLPHVAGLVLIGVFGVLIVADLIASVAVVRNFQKRLGLLTKLGHEIHGVSDTIGDTISDATLAIKGRADQTQARYSDYADMVRAHRAEEKQLAEQHRAEEQVLLEAARASGRAVRDSRYEEFRAKLSESVHLHNRILKAFPGMKSERDQEALTELREYQLHEHKEKEHEDTRV